MAAFLYFIGFAFAIVGAIWIVILAFNNGDVVWAIGGFFCWIALIVYAIRNLDEAKIPLGILGVGILIEVAARMLAGAAP
jgi:hypothetical protein